MKQLHVCYLGSAASIHVIKWAQYFRKKGHRISIISFDTPFPELADATFQLPTRGLGQLKYFFALLQLKRLLKQLRPDILHTIYIGGYGYMASRSHFHPLVITALGSDVLIKNITSNPFRTFLLRQFLKKTVRASDLIHCQARHLAGELAHYTTRQNPIIDFPYGVEMEQLPRKTIEQPSKKQPLIISTRYFGKIYNVQLLIEAIPFVLQEIREAKFIVLGGGPEKERLAQRISDLKIEKSVTLLDAITNRQELMTMLTKATIYVSTSRSDGASQSLLEAMAIGLFPVVTDIAANREWIEDGINGLLCLLDNPADLAAKVIRAIRDETMIEDAIVANRRIVEERASYTRNMALMERYYYQLCERPSPL